MQPIIAFTIIMLIWTVSDYISKKTKDLLSSLFVASIIFLIGFKTNLFLEDLYRRRDDHRSSRNAVCRRCRRSSAV